MASSLQDGLFGDVRMDSLWVMAGEDDLEDRSRFSSYNELLKEQ